MGAVEREEEVGEEEVEDAGDEEGEEKDLWFELVSLVAWLGWLGFGFWFCWRGHGEFEGLLIGYLLSRRP